MAIARILQVIIIMGCFYFLMVRCTKENLETDCDCRLVTEEIYVNTSSGLPVMDVRFSSEPYSNDCDDNNKILYADNRITKIVRCR